MEKEVKKEAIAVLLALIAIISLAVFVSSEITIGDPFLDIIPVYGPSQIIGGTATFALDSEPGNTLAKGQIGSNLFSMNLQDFLDEAGTSYSCEPANCLKIYNLEDEELEKTISFTNNKGYSAIQTTGENVDIDKVEFIIQGAGTGNSVCGKSPLLLDLLDDDIIDWEYKGAGGWCSPSYGEFYSVAQATGENIIDSIPYCEKIEIDKTGKIRINAIVKFNEGTPEQNDLIFSIYDNSDLLGQCSPGIVENPDYITRSCEIFGSNFFIEEKQDFFICMKNVGSAEYSIKSEGMAPFSGFYGNPPSNSFTKDYAISVHPAGFAPFNGEVIFNSTEYLGNNLNNLEYYIQSFLDSRYNSDCTEENGCAIPLKFIRTQINQEATITELELKWQDSGGQASSSYFYDVNIEYPLLTMSEKAVELSGLNVSVPSSYGTYSFIFTLGAESETAEFEVAQVPVIESLSPLVVIPGTEITFNVVASSPKGNNIESYSWNFGDGTTQTTTTGEAKHTYIETGTFNLVISATDSENLKGTRTFQIESEVTKEGINSSIKNKQQTISDFRDSLKGEWYDPVIISKLNLNYTGSQLSELYNQLETATEQELLEIKNSLDSLEIPQSIGDSLVFDESIYIPAPNIMRPDLVENLGGGSYDGNLHNNYIAAIIDWLNNQDITTSGAVKTVTYDDGTSEDLMTLTIVDISLASPETSYILVSLPANIEFQDISFKENYEEQEIDNSFAIIIEDEDSSTIEFIMPEGQQVSQLDLFMAPNLDTLNVQQKGTLEEKVPWLWAIIFIIIIILGVALGLYFIWKGKKVKKQKQLFKNPMDLYNLKNFVQNAQIKGMSEKDTKEKLEQAGWAKKQIDFAFGKEK